MVIVRWQKGDKFVEIGSGISVEINAPVLTVSSNVFAPDKMPKEWRGQVPRSDEQKVQKLIQSVQQWAESNGYKKTIG